MPDGSEVSGAEADPEPADVLTGTLESAPAIGAESALGTADRPEVSAVGMAAGIDATAHSVTGAEDSERDCGRGDRADAGSDVEGASPVEGADAEGWRGAPPAGIGAGRYFTLMPSSCSIAVRR